MFTEKLQTTPAKASVLLGAFLVANCLTACTGPSAAPPPATPCRSPLAISNEYRGDVTPSVNDRDQGTWRLGILANVISGLPEDSSYHGIVIGFKNPHIYSGSDKDSGWHFSDPLALTNTNNPSIQLGIGHSDIVFAVAIEANAGSSDCNEAPHVTFGDLQPLSELHGLQPAWPS